MCWVDNGVKNQRDVVMVWGRCGSGLCLLYLANKTPAKLPKRRARIGPLAAIGEIGLIRIGGRTSQFKAAPHVIAANESIAVGRVNKFLSLWRFKRGGC